MTITVKTMSKFMPSQQ